MSLWHCRQCETTSGYQHGFVCHTCGIPLTRMELDHSSVKLPNQQAFLVPPDGATLETPHGLTVELTESARIEWATGPEIELPIGARIVFPDKQNAISNNQIFNWTRTTQKE